MMMHVLKIIGAVIAWLIGLCVLGIVLDFARDFFGLSDSRGRRRDGE